MFQAVQAPKNISTVQMHRRTVKKPRLDICKLPERKLIKNLRFGRAKLRYIASLVKDDLRPKRNTNFALNLEQRVCVCLRILTSGSFQDVVGDAYGCSKQSVSNYFERFLDAMLRHVHEIIRFPLDDYEWLHEQSGAFEYRGGQKGLFGCIGAVDGTHVYIIKPNEDGDCYYSKGGKKTSMNIQITSGHDQRILDVCARNPGGNHDSFVFKTSGLFDRLEAAAEDRKWSFYVIGDKGYATSKLLVSPLRQPSNPRESSFNESLTKMRIVVEQAIGGVKQKFRAMHNTGGTLCYSPEKVSKIAVVACMLHNIRQFDEYGKNNEETDDSSDSEVENSDSESNSETSDDEDGISFRQSLIDGMH
ncbi:putative nuclease HARBI1 isoform X2 [Neocloeon triangulifer]|uniref:putative nuclease HARBI1 isoform X2 n=1 Tax=Neocloeon triangulifer TaxID=2078957 RepID=UPI00286F05D3|nr:putative nuclease HARBI1 isoform X2 [Neocloeon triangulifer]